MKLSIMLAATLFSAPALALVGPAEEDSARAGVIVMVLRSGAGGAAFCTGVVVARDAVLTAAHCVARAETTKIHFREGDRPVLLDVDAIAVHPRYRANAIRTRERSIDLALVRLRAPLPSRFSAATIERAPAISVGARFRIAGYGLAQEGRGVTGGVLRSGVIAARAPLSSILLWAEDPRKAGLGACTGDSGGPIFSEGGGVVAITSWTTGDNGKHCEIGRAHV